MVHQSAVGLRATRHPSIAHQRKKPPGLTDDEKSNNEQL
jgi:hypothetical protein